jgi:hypothetical protein
LNFNCIYLKFTHNFNIKQIKPNQPRGGEGKPRVQEVVGDSRVAGTEATLFRT